MPVGLLAALALGAVGLIVGGELLSAPRFEETGMPPSDVVDTTGRPGELIFDLAVAFASDDAYFRTTRGQVHHLDLKTGISREWTEGEPDAQVTTLAYDSNGHLLVGDIVGGVDFHTLKSVEPFQVTRTPHEGRGVLASAISRSGTQAVTGDIDGRLIVWDFARAEVLHTLQGSSGPVDRVEFSPDERWLLSTGVDHTAQIWNLRTGRLQTTFEGHRKRISAARFTPNGKHVITASLDGSLRCWNTRTAKMIWTSTEQTGGILAIAVSPDGRRLITGSLDGRIRIWKARTPEVLAEFDGHPAGISSLDLTPDGKVLISSGYDGIVRRWDLATLRQVACFSPGAG